MNHQQLLMPLVSLFKCLLPASTTSTAQTSDQTTAAETATVAAMEAYEAELEAWTKKAKKARKMIISMISPSVMTYVEGTKDPAEIIGRYPHKLQNWIPAKFAEFQS